VTYFSIIFTRVVSGTGLKNSSSPFLPISMEERESCYFFVKQKDKQSQTMRQPVVRRRWAYHLSRLQWNTAHSPHFGECGIPLLTSFYLTCNVCKYVCAGQILQLNFEADIFNRLSWNFVYMFNLDDNAWFTMWRHLKSNMAARTKWRTCYISCTLTIWVSNERAGYE
jgi:hypothetical protein